MIRRRPRDDIRSLRCRNGLMKHANNYTSQHGEDGILQRLLELLHMSSSSSSSSYSLVDVGAWDGKHLSNTYHLLTQCGWKGLLIEADSQRFDDLQALHQPLHNVCLCQTVSGQVDSPQRLEQLLDQYGPRLSLPYNFDFLCIDIDGSDYWVWKHLLCNSQWHPKICCIEFNPTIPNDVIYIPPNNDQIRHGASLAALVELATQFDYVLVETTLYNAFFVQQHLYREYLQDQIPDTSIEALHEVTMGTQLYQLYDGTLKLHGCKKLLWHRRPIDEDQIQVLSKEERQFPFAPDTINNQRMDETFEYDADVIDMSWYCQAQTSSDNYDPSLPTKAQQACSERLLETLFRDGFCYIRGTGLDASLCNNALSLTYSFLESANEVVRRSTLHPTDRARRGYSPMNTENFASLLGQSGPNDLVRKFRMGPISSNQTKGTFTNTSQGQELNNSLLQPNIWPDETLWDDAKDFRQTMENYYESACRVANAVVTAICRGMVERYKELDTSLQPLLQLDAGQTPESSTTTSILTLLQYRVGSRHKGKHKAPLVAAHTDVGVITVLLFDAGSCASLQRYHQTKDGQEHEWIDVPLPKTVPNDPILVVNVADCLSELTGGRLPSTQHRVVAKHTISNKQNQQSRSTVPTPRSCLALFVGLDPNQPLKLPNGGCLTYESWRKRRIARAQGVLRTKDQDDV